MEDYEILHKICVRYFRYSVRLTLCNAELKHYRLSYGGILLGKLRFYSSSKLSENEREVRTLSNLRRFVLANTYLPGPSPAKYFRHDRA